MYKEIIQNAAERQRNEKYKNEFKSPGRQKYPTVTKRAFEKKKIERMRRERKY